jgi:rRNA-processing protein FCF1
VDLKGRERSRALAILKTLIGELNEETLSSATAAQDIVYGTLGLTDSSIAEAASRLRCGVLTDDLELWIALSRQGIPAHNFMHLCAEFIEKV